MTSKIWVEGCKYSAMVGTILGLLLPGLPLLSAPSYNIAWELEGLPPPPSGCSDASLLDQYTTDNEVIYIFFCENIMKHAFNIVKFSDGVEITSFDVKVTKDGYFATFYDDEGNKSSYRVDNNLFTAYDERGREEFSQEIIK